MSLFSFKTKYPNRKVVQKQNLELRQICLYSAIVFTGKKKHFFIYSQNVILEKKFAQDSKNCFFCVYIKLKKFNFSQDQFCVVWP